MKNISASLLIIYMGILLVFSLVSSHTTSEAALSFLGEKKAPPELSSFKNIQDKKLAFFNFITPLIDVENNNLAKKRKLLLYIQEKMRENNALDSKELFFLDSNRKKFKVSQDITTIKEIVDELLLRINIVPTALVLAQAASESAWGTSRFATEGNNYFGQWCFKKGCGIVPGRRVNSASHEVRKFSSAQQSVRAYLYNINTHRAYKELRKKRQALEENQQTISADVLVEALQHYSERGEDYIHELKDIMRSNNLSSL